MRTRWTTKTFIEKSTQIHNNKYTYEYTIFKRVDQKVIITCPIHGNFEQQPASHLHGQGCRKCRYEQLKKTKESFIEKANKVHNYKYDYSKIKYKDRQTKIEIICPIHGLFLQIPMAHLRGSGCLKCHQENVFYNQEKFVIKAKEIHKNKYLYDLVQYKNLKSKVKIVCPIHGVFEQSPKSHLGKRGCPKCAKVKSITKEEFLKFSNIVHENKYDYSLVKFRTNNDKIQIICKKHGVFLQRVRFHLKGQGCPKCNESKGEKIIRQFLDKYNIEYEFQKQFPNCKHINLLKFDFFLPKYNIAIEYQGIQHYKNIFGMTNNNFEQIIVRDKIKEKYCDKNNIILLAIPYTKKNLINNILKYILNL